MKLILSLAAFLFFAFQAHAQTCPVTAGTPWATIKGIITGCASGNTVTVAAGTYTGVNSTVTIPCGVSISGPVLPYSQTHYQTAIFQGSGGITQPFHTTAGCTASQHLSYLEWNGEQATNAGGGVYVTPGTQNFGIDHNWFHGATVDSSNPYPGCCNEVQVLFAGSASSPLTKNDTVQWNEFGPETPGQDCGVAMSATSTSSGGGFCVGWASEGQLLNVSVDHNIFHNLEQGAKVAEAVVSPNPVQNGNTQNLTMSYNWFYYNQRINFETQSNYYDTSHPTSQTIDYNVQTDRNGNNTTGIGTGQQNFDFSIANGCGNPPATNNCYAHIDYNVDIHTINNTKASSGNEVWGSSGTTGNYNLMEGYVAGAGGGFIWNKAGTFTFNNNDFNIYSGAGQSTNCVTAGGGYWNHGNSPAGNPTCNSANTYSSVGHGTYPSAAPTISPNGGSFTGTQTVTLINTGVNRDLNTSIWYTLDGTAPVAGTSTLYTAPFSISASTVVKAIGMWGSLNQPFSYPSGYGYVPSSVQTASFTTSTVAATPVISPSSQTFNGSVSVSMTCSTPSPSIYYTSDGTTPTTGSTLYTGGFGISATVTLKALCTASGYTPGPVASVTYTQQTTANPTFNPPAPTVFSTTQTLTMSDATAGASIYYTTDGSTPTTGSTLYTGALTLSATTTVKALAFLAGYLQSGVTSGTYTYDPVNSLSSIQVIPSGGQTEFQVGESSRLNAWCLYSNGVVTDCSGVVDPFGTTVTWASSNTTVGTIDQTGLFVALSTGSSNISATSGGIISPAIGYMVTSDPSFPPKNQRSFWPR